MKKSFTLFSVSALFLMLLFPVSVKADTEISFALPSSPQPYQWTTQEDDCAGNFTNNVVTEGNFVYSGAYWNAVERKDDNWTGVGSGSKCCTRNLVPFTASTYTITLVTKRLSDDVTMTLPVITIQQGTPSTHYAATAKWDKDGVLQTEDVSSSHQFYYTDASDKKSRDKEVTLTYNNVVINAAGNYRISIDFPSGDKDKYLMKTLTIISSNPSYNVTVTADGSKGSVSGAGSKEQGSLVELSVSEEEGFAFNGWTSVSGVDLTGHLNDNPLSFTMPGNAVSLTADFTTTTCSKSKVIQCEDYDSGLSKPSEGGNIPSGLKPSTEQSGYQGTGYALFSDYSTGEMYFLVNLPASTYTFTVICQNGGDKYLKLYNSEGTQVGSGYQLTSSDWGGSWQTKTTSSYVLSAGNYYIGLSATNGWAAFDQITITASTNVFCSYFYNITMADGVNGGNPTADKASAEEGETVTVTAGEPASGYYFSGWTASSPSVEFVHANAPSTTFVMPAEDVTITANYGEVVSSKFTYTTSGSGSITCDTPSNSNVNSGTAISMTAVPGDDYVFTGWTATEGTFSDDAALTTTFTMPAEAATVTATFAQIDNVIITGTSATVIESNGPATLTVTSVSDFDAFNHNVLKFAYSDMAGKYKGQKVAIDEGYSPASSARATGFGFYYKTEKADDHVAFCFEVSNGQQVKWELQATNNVWKYYYFAHPEAAGWAHSGIFIYMNGDDGGNHTTYKDAGAFYMSEIAATTITSKPDIANYHYTNNRGGAMQIGDYGTLCLPMDGTISGATLYSVAGKETDGISYLVLEDQGTNVVAGKPYITQSTATPYTVTMNGAHSAVQDGNGLVGTYETINPLTPYNESGPYNYVLNENAFKKAGNNVTVGAYRAYLNWDEVSAPAPAPSARRIRMVIEGTEVETGMETVTAMPKTTKVLIDGQLFIIREGKRYTLTGARAQ